MDVLLGPKPLRALLFVHTLNAHGASVREHDVDAFIEARTTYLDFDLHVEAPGPRTVTYLREARLLLDDNGYLVLSPAGQAILRSARLKTIDREKAAPLEVVGRMTDPFVYAELLTRIDDVEASMLIDPYLHPRDLTALLKLSEVRRVLTLNTQIKGMSREERTQKHRISLGARPEVELRFASDESRELHDRMIIPSGDGESLMVGTSLGGTQLTVITRVGAGPTAALRAHYDSIWDAGGPVEPIVREAHTS